MITAAHLRVRKETGASLLLLLLAIVTASLAFLTFLLTTLRDEPASLVALLVFIGLSIVADIAWKRVRDHRSAEPPSAPLEPADG
jgi:S-adenosylmethionine:tRNA-ribosyltransferase-isomerase (queuine synthetase)